MNGINLHHVVRGAITSVHPDETVKLFINVEQSNEYGTVKLVFFGPIEVKAQIQSESDEALFHADRAGMNTETVKAYFYQQDFRDELISKKLLGFKDSWLQPFNQGVFANRSDMSVPSLEICDLQRFQERGGDMFQRGDGIWWLITAVPDNFSRVGWICVRATLQVNAPEGIIDFAEFEEEDEDDD